MSVQPQTQMHFDDWLAAERASSGCKSEFVRGEVFAMAGGSEAHNLIAWNVLGELRNRFKGRPCHAYTSDMKVRIEACDQGAYPDVMAVCGERRFTDEKKDCLLNPTLIVEVLSDSTEAYDRGDKFAAYRTIPSLAAYLLLSQQRVAAELYVRQGASEWLLTTWDDLSQTVPLACLDTELPLAELYDKVELTPPTPAPK